MKDILCNEEVASLLRPGVLCATPCLSSTWRLPLLIYNSLSSSTSFFSPPSPVFRSFCPCPSPHLPLPAPLSPPSPSPEMHLVKYSSQWKFGRNHSVSNLAPSYLIGDYVFALSSSLSIYFSHQIVGFLSHEKIIA